MSDDKKDLTRIEDLSEYLHEADPETERKFEETQKKIDANSSGSLEEDEEQTNQFEEFPGPSASDITQEYDNSEEFEETNDFTESSEETSFEPATDFEDEPLETNRDEFSSLEESNDFESSDEFGDPIQTEESESDEQEIVGTTEETVPEFEAASPSIDDSKDESQPEQFPANEKITTPIPTPAAEKFEDVRSFAQNITYSTIATGGNPPYSVMIKNIRFLEDAEEITTILEEFGLINDGSRKDIEQGLQNGALLISQISEYSAIFLAHKLRRFKLDISVGLSEELHPSKSYRTEEIGLVSKYAIYQNHSEEINLEEAPANYKSILITTTPSLENFEINRYIDIASTHTIIDEIELGQDQSDDFKEQLPLVYQKMAEKLKKEALKLKGNAVVGVNYQLTPLPLRKYKVSCTGNIVWISKKGSSVEENKR